MEARTEFAAHWRTLAGCTIAAAIGTIGLHAYTSGAFVPALAASAGYTKAQLSLATLILSASVAVCAPIAGLLMDRYGALKVVTFSVLGEAAMFALLGMAPARFEIYALCMVLLALLGVGTTPPGFARLVTARFDRGRGLALGMMISGLGIMAISGPIWATRVIAEAGWRGGYLTMAALVLLLGGAGVALIRSEGSDEPHGSQSRTAGAGQVSAFRRPLFWIMLVGFLAPALFSGGYLLHLISLLHERGFSASGAAQVQSMIGVAVLVGRLCSGVALDRFPAPRVAATAFTISALGCLLLLQSNPVLLGAGAFGIGLTIGAELDILAFFISRYFGLASFGRLYGLAYGLLIISGGASPVLINWCAGKGGYDFALIVSTVGTFAGALILLTLPDPRVAKSRPEDWSPAPAQAG